MAADRGGHAVEFTGEEAQARMNAMLTEITGADIPEQAAEILLRNSRDD
jgi:hypothetical protein